MEYDDEVTRSIHLIKSGKLAEAQLILEPYIQANPQDIQAWMWETEIFPQERDKIKVLEICLEYNPNDTQVLQALEILRNRSGIPQEVPPPEPSATSAYPEPVPVEGEISPLPIEAPSASPPAAASKSDSRRYKSRMLAGLWWILGGIAATIIATMIFSKLGYAYVAFGGVIVYGLYCLISGLVGWLRHMK